MKKQLCTVCAFLLLLTAATTGWLWLNSNTPVLSHGDALPSDIALRQYALDGIIWDETAQGYRLYLTGDTAENLTLTITDVDEVTILSRGKVVAAWNEHDLYQRVKNVTLSADQISENGGIDLLFQSSAWGSGTKEVLSRKTMTSAKLLLGGAAITGQNAAFAFGISMFSAGLHLLLILSSLALYIRKSSEKYLLFLAVVGTVSLTATLLTANYALIPIRRDIYFFLRPLIAICPVALHGAIGLFLYSEYAPEPLRKYLTMRFLLLMTLALVIFRAVSRYSVYGPVRWILVCVVVWTLARASERESREPFVLLAGYACSEAVIVFLYLINSFHLASPGLPIVYLQLNQLSYLFVLLPAMLIIHQRFAQKFQESEVLSEKLSRINAELDQLVEERSRQLREEQAKKNNMMTNIFHDIRSPIFVLQGNLAQLHLSKEEEPLKTAMEIKLDTLKRLTEDLFLISKLEEGGVLYEENPIDLAVLLRQMQAETQGQAEQAQIAVHFQIDGPLPVWGDWQRLQQALQNLVDNAFHYTPPGGEIRVKALRQNGKAQIEVRDTGAGIPPEDLPFLFERYFKNSRADNPHSSGLGLCIANEIIKHHRGNIEVESTVGLGTCFTVYLPLLPEE